MQQLIGWRSFVVSSLAIIGHVNTGRDGGTRRHAIAMPCARTVTQTRAGTHAFIRREQNMSSIFLFFLAI